MKSVVTLIVILWLAVPVWGREETDYGSPRRLAVSGDGRLIAVASQDNKVRVWDAVTGKLLHMLELDQPGMSVAFSADSTMLLAGTASVRPDDSRPPVGYVSAWSLAGGTPKQLWQAKQFGPATAMAVEPGGTWCATVTMYGRIHLFNLRTGELKRVLVERGNGLYDLAIAPNGKRLVTIGQHLRTWEPLAEPLPRGALPFDADPSDEESRRFLKSDHANGNAVTMAPDGTWAAAMTAYDTGTGRITNLARLELPDGKTVRVLARGLDGGNCVAISPDGKLLAVGFSSPKVELRAADTGQLIRTLDLGGFGEVRSISFLDSGTKLALAGPHGIKAEVRDAVSGERIHVLLPLR